MSILYYIEYILYYGNILRIRLTPGTMLNI